MVALELPDTCARGEAMFAVCDVVRNINVWVRDLQLSATPPRLPICCSCVPFNKHTYKSLSPVQLPRLSGILPLSWLVLRSLTREQVDKQCLQCVVLYET